jgi:hypothetical protein
MEEFEKQFDDMEVVTMTMEGTMDSSTASSTPAEDVDALIREVADQHGLDLDASFDTAVVPKKTANLGATTLPHTHTPTFTFFPHALGPFHRQERPLKSKDETLVCVLFFPNPGRTSLVTPLIP